MKTWTVVAYNQGTADAIVEHIEAADDPCDAATRFVEYRRDNCDDDPADLVIVGIFDGPHECRGFLPLYGDALVGEGEEEDDD